MKRACGESNNEQQAKKSRSTARIKITDHAGMLSLKAGLRSLSSTPLDENWLQFTLESIVNTRYFHTYHVTEQQLLSVVDLVQRFASPNHQECLEASLAFLNNIPEANDLAVLVGFLRVLSDLRSSFPLKFFKNVETINPYLRTKHADVDTKVFLNCTIEKLD